MISSISEAFNPASFKAFLHGPNVLCTRSSVIDSNCALDIFLTKCFGPDASALKYGRLISVSNDEDSSTLVFSAASLILW